MEKFIGSVSTERFIQGLLLTSRNNSLGDAWEKCADCNNCMFALQCQQLGDLMEAQGRHPSCGQIIDLLLGAIKPEDIQVRN
jgi:hypothetical protein